VKVYLAGPMSGHLDYNYPMFADYARAWRGAGHEVSSPAERFDGDTSLPYESYIRASIADVLGVDAVAVLPGWQGSQGAQLEVHIAKTLGLPVLDGDWPDSPTPYRESVLDEACRLVHGDRNADYAPPEEDFAHLGRHWGAILSRHFHTFIPDIDARIIGLMMCDLKINREAFKHKGDNLVDLAGYAECVDMVMASRETPATPANVTNMGGWKEQRNAVGDTPA